MILLKKQIGAVNFKELKGIFTEAHLAASN